MAEPAFVLSAGPRRPAKLKMPKRGAGGRFLPAEKKDPWTRSEVLGVRVTEAVRAWIERYRDWSKEDLATLVCEGLELSAERRGFKDAPPPLKKPRHDDSASS